MLTLALITDPHPDPNPDPDPDPNPNPNPDPNPNPTALTLTRLSFLQDWLGRYDSAHAVHYFTETQLGIAVVAGDRVRAHTAHTVCSVSRHTLC